MKFVYSLLLLITGFIVISCNENKVKLSSEIVFDREKDTICYNLPVPNLSQQDYYRDNNGQFVFRVTKQVHALGKNFGSLKNIPQALKFYKDNKADTLRGDLHIEYTVSLKMDRDSFEPIWIFKNPMAINSDGFIMSNINLYLDERYSDRVNSDVVQLIFKDYSQDGIIVIFEYKKNVGEWELTSRTKIDPGDTRKNQRPTFCIDTINQNIIRNGKTFDINFDDVLGNNYDKCY